MRLALIGLFLAALQVGGFGAETTTALEALKLLPPEKAGLIARIEGREGAPGPERWYLVVYDPAQDNAVQEFVVVGKQIVVTRSISQFAASLKPEDVIGSNNIALDSNQAFQIVQSYARANKVNVASLNYQLAKRDMKSVAEWRVKCLAEDGRKIGEIAITATDGRVISHDGFKSDPLAGAVALVPEGRAPVASNSQASDKSNVKTTSRRQQTARVSTPAPTPEPVAEKPRSFGDRFRKAFAPAGRQPTPSPEIRTR